MSFKIEAMDKSDREIIEENIHKFMGLNILLAVYLKSESGDIYIYEPTSGPRLGFVKKIMNPFFSEDDKEVESFEKFLEQRFGLKLRPTDKN